MMLNRIYVVFLVISFCFTLSYSVSLKDVIDVMISKGDKQSVEILKKEIEKKEFWMSYIQDENISLGLYANDRFIITASKKNKTIDVYDVNNHSVKKIKKIDALFGKIGGDKLIEGDLKTPIGVYDFNKRLNKKTKLEQRYGPLALTSNYPNLIDKNVFKKTGYGIWLHGKPLNGNSKIDTKGCIAIDNTMLIDLESSINYRKTILIISQDEIANTNKDEVSTILANLYEWRNAWIDNDTSKYMSFYNFKFQRFDKKDYDSFRRLKKNIFRKNQKKEILFSDMEIVPYFYGDNEKYFRIRFFEKYHSKSFDFKGDKELYLILKDNKISILTEK